jgi:hypothetical protein
VVGLTGVPFAGLVINFNYDMEKSQTLIEFPTFLGFLNLVEDWITLLPPCIGIKSDCVFRYSPNLK